MKINLGCGRNPLAGYLNVDLLRYDGINYSVFTFWQMDALELLNCTWPEPVTEIRADQFLEHLKLEQGLELLKLAWQVLAPGGHLRLTLPDWAAHVADYVDCQQRVPLREASIASGIFRPEVNVMLRIVFDWGHQMFYDREMLRTVLDLTGWKTATITRPDGANLVVEGTK